MKQHMNPASILCIEEDASAEDKSNELLSLSRQFKQSLGSMTAVPIHSGDVEDIKHDKFDQLVQRISDQIKEKDKENAELLQRLKVLDPAAAAKLKPEAPAKADKEYNFLTRPKHPFRKGDRVILLDAYEAESIGRKEPGHLASILQLGEGEDDMAKLRFDGDTEEIDVQWKDFHRFYRADHVEELKRNKVRELAHRGIELGALLDFYGKLWELMPDFEAEESTTAEVVKAAIIPASAKEGLAYSSIAHTEPRMATRMVSHNWANKFSHLVAAVVADAFDIPLYEDLVTQMLPSSLPQLIEELRKAGRLETVYWICAFSVNQHRSICKRQGCNCDSVMHLSGSPECEMDKFDDMMEYMFHDTKGTPGTRRHVVAMDKHGELFSRAWVVAELVATTTMDSTAIRQSYKAYSRDSLRQLKSHVGDNGVSLWECKAYLKEDEEMIKRQAKDQMAKEGLTSEQFHERLNARIFEVLEEAAKDVETMSKPHILCVGNSGVGTSTIIKLMTGSELFIGKTASMKAAGADSLAAVPHRGGGELIEYADGDHVFIEAPGLADLGVRQLAARNITAALKRDGQYQIFFVITLEAGRVRPDDKETLALVLSAAPINANYSVIINKVTPTAVEALSGGSALENVKRELFKGFAPPCFPTSHVFWVQKAEDGTLPTLPPGLLDQAPSVRIQSSRVDNVDGETPEERQARLQDHLEQLDKDNKLLEGRLEELEVVRAPPMKSKGFSKKKKAASPGPSKTGKRG